MKCTKLLSMLFMLLLTVPQAFSQQAVNDQDSLALIDLYNATNGPKWRDHSGWKKGPVESWFGITLTNDRVTEINLNANNLDGSIPASIGNLTQLQLLLLAANHLSGTLPISIGSLTKLQFLYLAENKLEGSIPATIGNLSSLANLNLTQNKLTGSIPAAIANLKNLYLINLSGNKLTGTIPAALFGLTGLKFFYLSKNKLSGSIPESIGELTNLIDIRIDDNQLTGAIPNTLTKLSNLWYLFLSGNLLSGSIPASIGNLSNLRVLSLSDNQLSGSIPFSLHNLTELDELNLANNRLSDSIPASIADLVSLESIYLANNKFTFAGMEQVGQLFTQRFPFGGYAPQGKFKLIREKNTLVASVGGTPSNNTFYWYRNGELETIIKEDSTFRPTLSGTYSVEAVNALADELKLISRPVEYTPVCDSLTGDGCITTWYRDADGDGWGNPSSNKEARVQPRGYISNKLDCDDKNKVKGGPEVCDGRDNDCDGVIDNGFVRQTYFSDFDGDSYGSEKRTIIACSPPPRYVSESGDCNDDVATVYPGAPELCDGRDNDCNGTIDDGLTLKPFYWDHDKDGYGFRRPVYACAAPRGYIAVGGDFNDNDTSIHPGAVEHCDGVDEDCDGVIDNGFLQKRFYKDKDGDGWGSNSNLMAGCAPKGYVERNGDCNDNNSTIHPNAAEILDNGIDENCDGIVGRDTTVVTQNKRLLIGVTSRGGARDGGTAFSMRRDGTGFNVFYSNPYPGEPNGDLVHVNDTVLLGMTSLSDAYFYGTIYKVTLKGTATLVRELDAGTGTNPTGSLIQAADGDYYGMTRFGGAYDAGTIFKITVDGKLTVLKSFSYYEIDETGTNPLGSLMQASDGNFYGMTSQGGAVNNGVIFKMTPGREFETLHNFDGSDGGYPEGNLVEGNDGVLYGMTSSGGILGGTVFKITKDGAFNVLKKLDLSSGYQPHGSLIKTLDGSFYGMTSKGGKKGYGTIFRIAPDGSFQVLKHLDLVSTGGTPHGSLLQGSDSTLYGMTSEGGTDEGGTIFQIKPDGTSFSILRHLNPKTDGGNPTGTLIFSKPVPAVNTFTVKQGSAQVTIPAQGKSVYKQSQIDVSLKALPNPSSTHFTLQIQSTSSRPVHMRIVDPLGRTIEVKHGISSNTTISIGQHYRPGTYVVEVQQEGKRVYVKLVKQ